MIKTAFNHLNGAITFHFFRVFIFFLFIALMRATAIAAMRMNVSKCMMRVWFKDAVCGHRGVHECERAIRFNH